MAPQAQMQSQLLPAPKLGKEPEMFIDAAINTELFNDKMSIRQKRRIVSRSINELELRVTALINKYFRFMAEHSDPIEQMDFAMKLDSLWKAYLRSKDGKYNYSNCKDFFATKLMFFIGDRKENKELLDKLKAGE